MQASRSLASTRCRLPATHPGLGTWPACNPCFRVRDPPPCCMRTKGEEEACTKRTLSEQKRERRSQRESAMVRLAPCTLEIRPLYSLLTQTSPGCCCKATLSDTAPTVHRRLLRRFDSRTCRFPALSEGANTQKTGCRTRKGSFSPLELCSWTKIKSTEYPFRTVTPQMQTAHSANFVSLQRSSPKHSR